MGVVRRHLFCGILEFESVGEYDVVALNAVCPEGLALFRRGACFHMADVDSQGVADSEETFVRSGIPCCVCNGARRHESDAYLAG
jgi:hypothetical protein